MSATARRQARLRERKRAQGLVLVQVWVHAEDRQWLFYAVAKLAQARLKPSDPS